MPFNEAIKYFNGWLINGINVALLTASYLRRHDDTYCTFYCEILCVIFILIYYPLLYFCLKNGGGGYVLLKFDFMFIKIVF